MLKTNQSNIYFSSNKRLVEITNISGNDSSREIKEYKRAKYIPSANCMLSLLSNTKDGCINGKCINIIELDSLYLSNTSNSNLYDIELYVSSATYRKSAKSISPNKNYFATVSEEGSLSIYNLQNSIKQNCLVPSKIEYNYCNKIISFKKMEIYNKNIVEFSADSRHLLIVSDDYISLLSNTSDNQWNFRLQFSRQEKNIGKHYFNNYLGCASFYFQDDILNLAVEKQNTQYLPIRSDQPSISYTLETSSQYSTLHKNNISATWSIQLYTCQLDNKHKLSEIIKKNNIKLLDKPQDLLFSPKGTLLAIRLENKISILSKVKDNWVTNTEINLHDNYNGKMSKYKFNFHNSVRMRFNNDENKLITKIGRDKIIVSSLVGNNNNWETCSIKNFGKSKINFADIDKIDINFNGDYIILSDFSGCITLLQEKNKEYIFVKDFGSDKVLFGINSLSFSEDGKKIIAASNNIIKVFMPF